MRLQAFHRFADEAAFLAACDAAGWARDHLARPVPQDGVALDLIGPWADRPTVVDGVITPGAVDARWHANALWPAEDAIPAEWAAARITPATPGRVFAGVA